MADATSSEERSSASESQKEGAPKPSFRRVLSNKSVSSLWVSQLISQSGDYVFNIALLWFVLLSTGSAFWVAITQAIMWLPPILVGPIAGVYADKSNRRNLILLTNLIEGIVVAVISVFYVIGILHISLVLVLVFALFAAAQFLNAAIPAIIPRMVSDKADLAPANSLFSLSNSVNRLASFSIGGVIVAIAGVSVPMIYDSLTFFIAAAIVYAFVAKSYGSMASVQPSLQNSSVTANTSSPQQPSFWTRFMDGVKYVRSSHLLVELVLVGMALNFFLGAASSIVPSYARVWLQGDSIVYGLLVGTLSLGALLASFVYGKLDTRNSAGRIFILAVLVSGGAVAGMGIVREVSLALFLVFVVGFANSIGSLSIQVLVQARVPSHLIGRVITALVAVIQMATPIAAVLSGGLVTVLPIGLLFEVYGIMLIAITILAFVLFKDLRSATY